MTVDFTDYFWGEKNSGFDVLYHNMKYGLVASKELSEFFRERSNIEELNSKQLAKLAKQAGSGCAQGTFAPVWQVLKASSERLATLHVQMVQKVSELVKDISKYADELHKKYKVVKENESGTLEVVQAMQSTTLALQKAKDLYLQKNLEYDKLRKENTSPKDLEKAEAKLRKFYDDFKALGEKYLAIKADFEKKMSVTCKHFQDIEEAHLTQMKDFLNTYSDVVQHNHDLIGQVHTDFQRQCLELSIDKLLEQFVLTKYTGLEIPSGIEELNIPPSQYLSEAGTVYSSTQVNAGADASVGGATQNMKPAKREGFLRSRRDKAKVKKVKKKGDNSGSKKDESDISEEKEDQVKSAERVSNKETEMSEKDDEGFSVPPKTDDVWTHTKDSFYSSSDSDSDEGPGRKIHVRIKPLSNGGAPISSSVHELRATVENIFSLTRSSQFENGSSAEVSDMTIKRSQSVSQQLDGFKASNDLLGLNTLQSPVASNASTPTSGHPYAPLQSPPVLQSPLQQGALNSPTLSGSSRYTELGDLVKEVGEMKLAANTFKVPARQTPTPTLSAIALPRPPSRRSEQGAISRGYMSPSSMTRTDSIGSLEFRTTGIAVGTSRGPSPLTIGIADTIPLAVAFHEIIHSYFRGTDESLCQVKMSGDMMLSFPAGIRAILANNPNPAKLVFRLRNTHLIESIVPNKELVSIDESQSTSDSMVLDFTMSALNNLLRAKAEENPCASYFNVDIIKYQVKTNLGASSCPFQLVAYWKCSPKQTDLKIDYKYNSRAMTTPSPLLNVTVVVPVNGAVKSLQAKPTAQWLTEENQAVWKFTELSLHSENNGVGSIRARFEMEEGPCAPTTISTQFNCEGTILSGLEFELVGTGYRLSLVKRGFKSGKYVCDGDSRQVKGTPVSGSETVS